MPANEEARLLPLPWREFLTELDGMLDESLDALYRRIRLHVFLRLAANNG
jgi:hypothetical protein